jgi:hypothetical protein
MMRGRTPALRPVFKRRDPWRSVNNYIIPVTYADFSVMALIRWDTRSTENALLAQGLA